MRAALYKEQQEAARARRDPVFAAERQSKRLIGIDVSKLKGKNQGVSQRNMRDMEHIKVRHTALSWLAVYTLTGSTVCHL